MAEISDNLMVASYLGDDFPIEQYISRRGEVRYRKPDWFDSRQFCGAAKDDGTLCQNVCGACLEHCGAFSRTTGRPCRKPRSNGTSRCITHGGASRKMQAAGRYTGKSQSKYLPKELQAQYAEIMERPDLLSLRNEIGLVQIRINQLTQQLSTKASSTIFSDLGESWNDFKAAMSSADRNELLRLRGEIDAKILEGAAIGEKWAELIRVTKDKGHLARVEMENMIDANLMVSVEAVIMMLGVIGETAQKHVTDKKALAAITNELAKLLGAKPEKKSQKQPIEIETLAS
jgi:hypothetical protein